MEMSDSNLTVNTIRAIDKTSIQKICCGQVIVDLCGAVKELLENSLDSGATIVEIKLKDMGMESIEVTDNGSGIDKANYETLALKHHTSKLNEFTDLENGYVTSFGFRGEALNAVCELSREFTVTTKQENEKVGFALSFQRNGKLSARRPVARPVGTTVRVEGLFEALPVRRGDFVRSIKKQYQKMVKVLSSYAVVSVGVNISVTNISKTGSRQTVLSTQSSARMEDNISSVFGSKFMSSLMPLKVCSQDGNKKPPALDSSELSPSPSPVQGVCEQDDEQGQPVHQQEQDEKQVHDELEETQEEEKLEEKQEEGCGDQKEQLENALMSTQSHPLASFTCSGFVSKPREGVGRSDSDRQYIFVNSRPVDIPRINRVMNEMWRRFEMAQKPAFILNITVAGGAVDLNLAPDKREVLIPAEGAIIDALRTELEVKFAPTRNTFAVNSGGFQQPLSFTTAGAPWPKSPLSFLDSGPRGDGDGEGGGGGGRVDHDGGGGEVGSGGGNNLTAWVEQAAGGEDGATPTTPHRLPLSTTPQSSQESLLLSCSQSSDEVMCSRDSSGSNSNQAPRGAPPDLTPDQKNHHGLTNKMGSARSSKKQRKSMWLESQPSVEWASKSQYEPSAAADQKDRRRDQDSSRGKGATDNRKRQRIVVSSDDEDAELHGKNAMSEEEEEDADGFTSHMLRYVSRKCSRFIGNKSASDRKVRTPLSHNTEIGKQRRGEEEDEGDVCLDSKQKLNTMEAHDSSKDEGGNLEDGEEAAVQVDDRSGMDVVADHHNTDIGDVLLDSVIADDARMDVDCAEWDFDPDLVLRNKRERVACLSGSNAERTPKVSSSSLDSGSRVLSKADFSRMRVLGQFNLGFIIACLDTDLYILDQHACDEKFIFERLSRETVIHKQPLLIPMVLETTPSEEILVQDHMSIFEANGFKIQVQADAPPGRRLRLTTVPFSKHVVFDHKDVHELAALIGAIDKLTGGYATARSSNEEDAPTSTSSLETATATATASVTSSVSMPSGGFTSSSREDPEAGAGAGRRAVVDSAADDSVIPNLVLKNISDLQACVSQVSYMRNSTETGDGSATAAATATHGIAAVRLPKLLNTFASRACRSAVMIGTALQLSDMSSIVSKLGTIEQPWNCPHGRPTMRHLTDLGTLAGSPCGPGGGLRVPFHRRHLQARSLE